MGGRALVDHALDRLRPHVERLSVNLHHGADALDGHLPVDVHRSVEMPVALGTAGALGALRPWVDGRDVLLTNSDAWFAEPPDLRAFVAGWDRDRVRLLCVPAEAGRRADFGPLRYCGVALMPWAAVATLSAEPSGLYEVSWADAQDAGELDLVTHDGQFVDCGTVQDYLGANLASSGGASVIDPTAQVGEGAVLTRSVVWDHSRVAPGEVLVNTIRAGSLTVLVR